MPWRKHFYSARRRCNVIKDKNYIDYGLKGIKFKLSMRDVKFMWFRDKANSMKHPSIDRINSCGDYQLDNCQFLEHNQNTGKELKKKILQYDLNGIFIKEWESLTKASKELNIQVSGINAVLKGRYNSSGGYKWRYK